MSDDTAPAGVATQEGMNDLPPESDRDAKPWLKMIEHGETTFAPWQSTCDKISADYASLKKLAQSRTDREFQMFYANLEVLKPSIYARAPAPVVVQRFKDQGRSLARKAGEIMERALISSFDAEKVHETLKRVRDDLALTGRGTLWARYETYEKPDGVKECVRYEWVHRRDFLHEPARFWPEVGWVARRVWLTEAQGKKRFGKAWTNISYENAKDTADDYKVELKAAVWELWHREKNLVVWLHPNAPEVLDIAPPHLNLEGFFPCPRPAYGTCEADTLIPVPDACFYKDQLEEINELTARISALSESLRMAGFYPAGAEDIGTAIETAIQQMNQGENRRILVPLAGFTNFGGAGSLKDSIVWLPVVEVANTIVALVSLRKQLIDDVYQISGISDIMRGQTEASETLGAQQLKSQYGSIRIKDRQGEMVRLADGVLNIAGEIMAENFAPATLLSMSQTEDLPKQADVLAQHQQEVIQQIQQLAMAQQQAMQPPQLGQPPQAQPDPAQFEQQKQAIILQHQKAAEEVVTLEKVFGFLRDQKIRPFVLQVATDSTIQPDENAEKQARNEFGVAFAQLAGVLGPMIQQNPEMAPFAGEMLKFQLAPYRAGRQMDQSIDDFVEQMTKKAKQPPPPNPEQIKAEAEAKAMQQDMEIKAADLEDRKLERAAKVQAQQGEGAAKAEEAARKMQETEARRQDDAVKRQREIEDRQARTMDEQRKAAEAARKADHDAFAMRINLAMKQLELDIKRLEIAAKAEEAERAKNEKAEKEMQAEAKETQRHESDEMRKAQDNERSAKRDEATSAALASLQETMAVVAQAQQALAESMARPKTIKFNAEGRPVGIQ